MTIHIGDKVYLWSNFCLDYSARQQYMVVDIEDDWYADGSDSYLYRVKGLRDGEEVLVEDEEDLCLLGGNKRKWWGCSECWSTFRSSIDSARQGKLVAKFNRSWITV